MKRKISQKSSKFVFIQKKNNDRPKTNTKSAQKKRDILNGVIIVIIIARL
jgi:hypothetical protein